MSSASTMESPPDRVEHWRDVAERLNKRIADLQREYDEHVATSASLEKELETTLDQKDAKIRELQQQTQRLDRELESQRKKGERLQRDNTRLEAEAEAFKNERERHISYIRELEQKNDDLERGQRVVSESIAGIEALLHQAYERNAALESEVDEMENLKVKLQRVTDEARDLKQELHIKDRVPNGNLSRSPPRKTELAANEKSTESGRLVDAETSFTPLKTDVTTNGNTMTPSSRISALNIVGDLLRKVGSLESKLASCRAPIHNRESSNGTSEFNRDPYRMRRISNRGPASPAITPNYIH